MPTQGMTSLLPAPGAQPIQPGPGAATSVGKLNSIQKLNPSKGATQFEVGPNPTVQSPSELEQPKVSAKSRQLLNQMIKDKQLNNEPQGPLAKVLGTDYEVSAQIPALALLMDRLEQIDPKDIPTLITENAFIQEAISGNAQEVLSKQSTIIEIAKSLDLPPKVLTDALHEGLPLDSKTTPIQFLKSVGINPQKVLKGIERLRHKLTKDGIPHYIARATALHNNQPKDVDHPRSKIESLQKPLHKNQKAMNRSSSQPNLVPTELDHKQLQPQTPSHTQNSPESPTIPQDLETHQNSPEHKHVKPKDHIRSHLRQDPIKFAQAQHHQIEAPKQHAHPQAQQRQNLAPQIQLPQFENTDSNSRSNQPITNSSAAQPTTKARKNLVTTLNQNTQLSTANTDSSKLAAKMLSLIENRKSSPSNSLNHKIPASTPDNHALDVAAQAVTQQTSPDSLNVTTEIHTVEQPKSLDLTNAFKIKAKQNPREIDINDPVFMSDLEKNTAPETIDQDMQLDSKSLYTSQRTSPDQVKTIQFNDAVSIPQSTKVQSNSQIKTVPQPTSFIVQPASTAPTELSNTQPNSDLQSITANAINTSMTSENMRKTQKSVSPNEDIIQSEGNSLADEPLTPPKSQTVPLSKKFQNNTIKFDKQLNLTRSEVDLATTRDHRRNINLEQETIPEKHIDTDLEHSKQSTKQVHSESGNHNNILYSPDRITTEYNPGDVNWEPELSQPIQQATHKIFNKSELLVQEGGGTVFIDLADELGDNKGVGLSIQLKGDDVKLQVVSQSDELKDSLTSGLSQLQSRLSDHNLKLVSVDLGTETGNQESHDDNFQSEYFDQQSNQSQFHNPDQTQFEWNDDANLSKIPQKAKPVKPYEISTHRNFYMPRTSTIQIHA